MFCRLEAISESDSVCMVNSLPTYGDRLFKWRIVMYTQPTTFMCISRYKCALGGMAWCISMRAVLLLRSVHFYLGDCPRHVEFSGKLSDRLILCLKLSVHRTISRSR